MNQDSAPHQCLQTISQFLAGEFIPGETESLRIPVGTGYSGETKIRYGTIPFGITHARFQNSEFDCLLTITDSDPMSMEIMRAFSDQDPVTAVQIIHSIFDGDNSFQSGGLITNRSLPALRKAQFINEAITARIIELVPATTFSSSTISWKKSEPQISIGCDIPIGTPGRPEPTHELLSIIAKLEPAILLKEADRWSVGHDWLGTDPTHPGCSISLELNSEIEQCEELDIMNRLRVIKAGREAQERLGITSDKILKI